MPHRHGVVGLGLLTILLSFLTVLAPVDAVAAAPLKPPKVAVGDSSVTEADAGGVVATFKVTLKKGVGKKVKVSWTTADGTATAPADYTATSGKLVFKGPAKKQTKTITVAIAGDDVVEPDETFKVNLTKVKGGKLKRASATGTIANDDTAPAFHTLNVSLAGAGGGTVTSEPTGIDCLGSCSHDYLQGTTVQLSAAPNNASTFAGWSGACSGTGLCEVTMSQARSVTATFSLLPTFSLQVTKQGTGTGTVTSTPAGIDCGIDCAEAYPQGTSVTLTAAPGATSDFQGWTGDCTGTGDCTVSMTQVRSVQATFAPKTYQLSVTKDGTGAGSVSSTPAGINCGGDCNEVYNNGQIVTLSASPSAGSTFTGWSGGGCSGTGTCVVTMTGATSVTATFTVNSYALSVTQAGTGSGTVTSTPAGINCGGDCTEGYTHGTTVTLTAAPSAGSTFTAWSNGGCSGTGTCVVTMTAATSVTATFTPQTYLLSVSRAGPGTGTVTSSPAGISCGVDCTESYNHGTTVTLTAAPAAGADFTGWSNGGCSGTGTCVVTMTAATTVTATFTQQLHTLTVSKAGSGSGTVTSSPAGIFCGGDCTQDYTHGTMVTLSPVVDSGSTFGGWAGACTGTGTCTVTMDAAKSVLATFPLQTFTLTVTRAGPATGTVTSSPAGINCGSDCTESYNNGTTVTLTAAPAVGATFTGWSGGGCSGTGTCTVTMTAATTVTATFTPQTYLLTVTRAGPGTGTVTSSPAGINCGTDCTESYNHGTSVTLTALAAGGSVFAGWSGACSGTGTCTVTMTAATSVTAVFNPM